jgi:hypothetical protein
MVNATRIIHANVTSMAVTVDNVSDFADEVRVEVGPITSVKQLS